MRQLLIARAAFVLCGCEKIVMDDGVDSKGDSDGNVVLNITPSEFATRSGTQSLGDICGRLNVAVFDADGRKVKSVAQSASDAGFGSIGLSLSEGSYSVVAIGHNCTGSATITSPEKVTFPNNKVTDTFAHYGTITVTGSLQEVGISLQRAVAMVRIRLDDDLAAMANVAQLKFYYVGGSSTFSPSSGVGCVNSKQTEYRTFSDDGVYCLYTLPHETSDVLTKLTITALDAGDNVVGECTIENIPVTVNRITDCTGTIAGGKGAVTTTILVNPDWDGIDSYTF